MQRSPCQELPHCHKWTSPLVSGNYLCPSQIVLQHVSHEDGEEHHPMHVFNRDMLNSLLTRLGFALLFRDYGSEFFYVPGVSEPVVHNSYLLQKIRVKG